MDASPSGAAARETERAPAFKVCGACRRSWSTWDEFATDPEVRLLGLQAVANVPDASVLVFEHRCGSSISVLTRRLRHLLPPYDGPALPVLRDTDQCARHCFDLADHGRCDRRCSNARDRELLVLVEGIHASR
ncbi:MAG TPA: hypothetical protein VF832_12000 [Longimicrobiales bacterium]